MLDAVPTRHTVWPIVSETDLPPLAVVVVNWNGRKDLADCFRSLLEDPYPGLRVIMVDNGSEDDSVAWTRLNYPGVEILETGANLRWAGGNNFALRSLRQEGFSGPVLLLNNDTIVPEGSLARLVQTLIDHPEAWAATPRICYAHDPARAWYDGGLVGSWSGWVRHAGIRKLTGQLPMVSRYVDYGTGCALLLAPGIVEKIGELDEGYFFYGEDVDFSLRLRAAGGRIVHQPRALVLHKVSSSLGGMTSRKAFLRSRSHVRLLCNHWPARAWPVLILTQLAYFSGHALWHLWQGRLATALAVWLGALAEVQGRKSDGC